MTRTRKPWNARNRRTIAQEHAYQQCLADTLEQTSANAAELRWNAFVDTMLAVAAELATERPADRSEGVRAAGGEQWQGIAL
jgi:hypothetical protein